MRGRWALGVAPRDLTWIIKDKLAVCERLGGCGTDHRPVRRTEEIIWFRRSEFSCLVSLIAGPQNVSEYQKEELNYLHFLVPTPPPPQDLADAYAGITKAMAEGETLLMHREKIDDVVAGFLAGYGLFRFVTEFFRQPDAHKGFVAFEWMSMGQLLSLPMLAAGLFLLFHRAGASAKPA